jgi:hypothetical protein
MLLFQELVAQRSWQSYLGSKRHFYLLGHSALSEIFEITNHLLLFCGWYMSTCELAIGMLFANMLLLLVSMLLLTNMLLLANILLLVDMLLLASLLLLTNMLLKLFVDFVLFTYLCQTNWLSSDRLSIGSITGMSSQSWIFYNSSSASWCTVFSLSHFIRRPLVDMFLCSFIPHPRRKLSCFRLLRTCPPMVETSPPWGHLLPFWA